MGKKADVAKHVRDRDSVAMYAMRYAEGGRWNDKNLNELK